jgi:hypothetical protein
VVLVYGGNWCSPCLNLHNCFYKNSPIKKLLDENYCVVLVDIKSNRDLPKRFGASPDTEGVQYLTVLDKEGKVLVNQSTDSLEADSAHDPNKVSAFLTKWKPDQRQGGLCPTDTSLLPWKIAWPVRPLVRYNPNNVARWRNGAMLSGKCQIDGWTLEICCNEQIIGRMSENFQLTSFLLNG